MYLKLRKWFCHSKMLNIREQHCKFISFIYSTKNPLNWVKRTTQKISKLTINDDITFGLSIVTKLHRIISAVGRFQVDNRHLKVIASTFDLVLLTGSDFFVIFVPCWFDAQCPSTDLQLNSTVTLICSSGLQRSRYLSPLSLRNNG